MLTLSNLFLGCLSLIFVFKRDFQTSAFLVLAAAVVDFLDGFIARLLNAHSDIGKDLDSLADCVTFGVVPGFVIYTHLQEFGAQSPIIYVAFLVPLMSALRLARFNHDVRQGNCFYGLPTPANGLFIVFLPEAISHFQIFEPLFSNVGFWLMLTFAQSYLLISPFRLQAFKFKDFGFSSNWPKYLIMVFSLPLLVVYSYFAIPFVILIYIFLSLTSNLFASNEIQS